MVNLRSSPWLVQVDNLDILPGLPNKQTNKQNKETNTVSKRWRILWSSDKSYTSLKFVVVVKLWNLEAAWRLSGLLHFGNFWEQTETKFLRNNNISSSKFMTNSMETKLAGSRFR